MGYVDIKEAKSKVEGHSLKEFFKSNDSNYQVAGVESGMKEHTIVRKSTINKGTKI